MHKYSSAIVGLLAWAVLTSSAQAHIKLLKPESWLNEDDVGGPQKGGPCGPGSFDDVQPVPMSMKVTTVTAGETIMVEFEETIHHPGWFRIALAEDPSEFEEIEFPNANNCTYDMSKVPTEPHGNVLVDGLGMDEAIGGPNRKFMEMVKLPDTPCEKCTLQVIQVMADALHSPPGCIYYHCAELKILPKDGAAAGSGGSAAAGSGGSAGADAAAGSSGGAGMAGGAGTAAAAGGAGAPAGTAGVKASAAGAGGAATKPSSTTGGSAGKPAVGGTAAPAAGSGMTAASDDAAADPDESGCTVVRPASGASNGMGGLWLALPALGWVRRRLR